MEAQVPHILGDSCESGGADIEGVVDPIGRMGGSPPDGVAQVADLEQLVAVVPWSEDGDALAGEDPVVEDLEDTEASRTEKGLRAHDRHAVALGAVGGADLLSCDLAFAVRTHANHRVGLVYRVLVGDAVDGG